MVNDARDSRETLDRVREASERHDREDRELAARLSVSERLTRGVALSMFAVRMRDAFRDQSGTG
jgi:hypothetical protein